MNGNYLFAGLEWKKRVDKIVPYMILRNGGKDQKVPLLKGDNLRFKILNEKYCLGYNHNPCPFSTQIKKGMQCFKCKQIDDRHACKKCVGERCMSELGKDYCFNNEFAVYLASFGDILKVGVSSTKRVVTRWVEQGADCAVKALKAGNGLEARKIESMIAKKLGVKTAVRSSQKKSLMLKGGQPELIGSVLEKVHEMFPDHVYSKTILNVDEKTGFDFNADALDYDEKLVSGKIIGVKGSWIFLKSGRTSYSLNTNLLKASLLGFSKTKEKPTVQARLFT
ncbi:MAG: DUF2797 domain-containing protein [Nanoarchaeota archaeon]|nr:DUF2797 domain-containing protein [Nanoarchaeota archaeon]